MRNFHDRISFSEYIYAIKLKNVLNNEAYQDNVDFKKNSFINSSIHFMFNNIESIIFSIDQQNYHNNNHVTIDIDILKRINQCLLITNRSKYQLLSGIKRKVFWYQLARNESFLQCLMQIIPTGYGDPYFQEIAFIIISSLVWVPKHLSQFLQPGLEKCEAALKNLIHIAAGPLVIFSSSSGLGQLTNWSTQALTGLLKATFIYNPNLSVNYNNDVWMEKLLLFSHVVHLSKYIDDEVGSFNLEILSSHFNLLTLILMKLPSVQVFLSTSTSSSDDRTTIQDREKFLDIIQYSFLNFCLAIGKVWLCSLCTNNLVLCIQCDQILKMLSSVTSLELLTIERIIQMICSFTMSTDIISYIMSIIEYI
ncbi:hypothetical protein KSF78_0004246 [Schistosoma japonicum]|nr:hypothetical protein KSF78_0004246 [Schistosoma japonicum]